MSRTITLTPEQTDAYEAGRPFTVTPPLPAQKRYIVVLATGNVFDVLTRTAAPVLNEETNIGHMEGDCRLIAAGLHTDPIGTSQSGIAGRGIVVEIPLKGRDKR